MLMRAATRVAALFMFEVGGGRQTCAGALGFARLAFVLIAMFVLVALFVLAAMFAQVSELFAWLRLTLEYFEICACRIAHNPLTCANMATLSGFGALWEVPRELR